MERECVDHDATSYIESGKGGENIGLFSDGMTEKNRGTGMGYRINSDIRDTSVSAIALVFSFFQYARPLLFWALHIMIGQLLEKTKKTALSPKTEVSLISELIRYPEMRSSWRIAQMCGSFYLFFSVYSLCCFLWCLRRSSGG
jgi:hypothetical protein